MMKRIYDWIYNIYVTNLVRIGCNSLWKKYSSEIQLKPLTKQQKYEIVSYYKGLCGIKVNTRWHQLFYSLTGEFKVTYLPFELYHRVITKLSPFSAKKILDDKCLYRYLLKDFNIPNRVVECNHGNYHLLDNDKWITVTNVSDVYKCLDCDTDLIIKPSINTSAGNGVRKIKVHNGIDIYSNETVDSIVNKYDGNYVVEELIEECDNLKKLNPSSYNSLRIHTYRDAIGVCHYLSSYVRIGRSGSHIDNASAGGITAPISMGGVLTRACVPLHYEIVTKTDSGEIIEGYVVESFNDIVNTTLCAHYELPLFGIIGWDVTIDNKGRIIIIEFNPDPDMRKEQYIFKDTCLGEYQEDILKRVYNK